MRRKSSRYIIKRDKSFAPHVALKFGELPAGEIVEPTAPVIKQGDAKAQVTLTVADDAEPGNFTIKVVGHPAQGANAAPEFKLTVAEK